MPSSLTTIAYATVASIALGLLLMLGWALARLGSVATSGGSAHGRRARARRTRAIAAEGSAS